MTRAFEAPGQMARLVAGCQLSGPQPIGSQVCKDSIKRGVGSVLASGGQEVHADHPDLGFPIMKYIDVN